jgi:hypothetical protein
MSISGAEQCEEPGPKTFVSDLPGEPYGDILERMHRILKPRTYFEIGCLRGNSLRLAGGKVIGVDPDLSGIDPVSGGKHIFAGKEACHLYQMTSDAFFVRHDPRQILGEPIDMAFLDGMHLWEFLLRDFMNTEKHCRRNSIIVMHDCLPVDVYIAEREDNHARRLKLSSKPQWWAGDVWKTVVALRKFRPDLVMLVLDAPPTGLVLITNLNPASRVLDEDYFRICTELASVDLLSYGLERHFAECDIHNTRQLTTAQDFAARFWL